MSRIWYDNTVYVPLRTAAEEDAVAQLVKEIAGLGTQEQEAVLEALHYGQTKNDEVFKYLADRNLVEDVSDPYWSFDTSPRGMTWVRMSQGERDQLRSLMGADVVENEDQIPDEIKELGFVEAVEGDGMFKKVKYTPAAQVLLNMTEDQYDAFWEVFVDNQTTDKDVIELVAALGFADQVYTNLEYEPTELGDALLEHEAVKKALFGG